jgi:septal ring factor EnvC (AmiA/AmiB activator)
MVNSNCTSPAHYSLAGNFSPEDMQELLGAMGDEQPLSRPLKTESNSLEGSLEEPGSEVGSNLLQVGEDFKDDGDGLNDIPEDGKVQARSERKKNREKQRRSDVNRQFADLTHMLRQIEAEEAEDENSKARLAFNAANRVDLITRTISQLERLRESSKRRKLEVSSLELQLEQAKQAGEDTAAKLKETMFNQPTGKQQVGLKGNWNRSQCFRLKKKVSN